jgi:hypothetical protein
VKHSASPEFWAAYGALPAEVRALADRCYKLLQSNPSHPSLRFKPVGRFWSVRVGLHYRAVGVAVPDGVVWFWIGSHAEYDRLIRG